MYDDNPSPSPDDSRTSRRLFLRNAAVAGGALVGGPALLAAGGSNKASSEKPKRGGVLRVGVSGGGSADTQNVIVCCAANTDLARIGQLYEPLAFRDHHWNAIPGLGTHFIPGKGGREMIVKLRRGVEFHNGKPLTADDVVYTFRQILDPKVGSGSHGLFSPFVDRVEKVDPHTVRFSFRVPFYDFEDFAGNTARGIIPADYDPKHPVGTGPFKIKSFTPGQESVYVRNENYWKTGIPYLDSVVLTDISDDAARVNALISGAVDAIDTIPYALIPTVKKSSNFKLLVSHTGTWHPITMRVDRPPFNDPRVTQAFKLIVNRPQIVQNAYGGYAKLGNDLFAVTDKLLYDDSIPQRVQDIDKAKSLLKRAGREGLSVNLVTAPVGAGTVQESVLFAQQAKAAGVNVKVTKLDNGTFYNNQFLNRAFSVDGAWTTTSFLEAVASGVGPSAPFNETHFSNKRFNKLYFQVVGSDNPHLRKELANEMQQILWDEGGNIIPGHLDTVDAYHNKVKGFVPDASGYNLSFWGFANAWLT